MSGVGEDYPDLNTINFCKLVVTFARSLDGCNVRDALNYLYLLKYGLKTIFFNLVVFVLIIFHVLIRSVKDEHGDDLFSICVGDMILESRDFDAFGIVNSDGCRSPGLLDQMGIPSHPIVSDLLIHSPQAVPLANESIVIYIFR